jgi:lysozyme
MQKKRKIGLIATLICVVAALGVFMLSPYAGRMYRRVTGDASVVPPMHTEVSRNQYPVKGIDISHHNGRIDFAKVAADSVDFVVMKASEGVNYIDSCLARNYAAAEAQNLYIGFYHFFKFNHGGVRQGRHFMNTIKGMRCNLPLVIDVESDNNESTNYYLVVGRLRDMIKYLERRGQRVMIYTNRKVYEKYIQENFPNIDLWLASERTPDMGKVCRLWQHSHNGHVSGISRPVDINAFNGSRTDFEKWITLPDSVSREAAQ